MSVSKKLKLILPRIPKCGSTSTTTWLKEQDPSLTREETEHHNPLSHYVQVLADKGIKLDGYKAVMVGRNPFKRQVSAFEYQKMLFPEDFPMTFEEFYTTIEQKHISFINDSNYTSTYDDTDKWWFNETFYNQHHYFIINNHPNFPLEMLNLVQLENFKSQMEELGFSVDNLRYMNKHNDREGKPADVNSDGHMQGSNYDVKEWQHYYGKKEIVKKIQELYKYDFILFGYDPSINPYTEEPW